MTVDTNALIGAEQIQRALFYTLFENLNTNIGLIESYMHTSDQEFASVTGRPVDLTEIERVEPEDFHEGHVPSLISAPIDNYPNCAVISVRSTPAAASDQFDQQDAYQDLIAVEVMVKSIVSESEVDRRLKRTAEAVHITLKADETLGGKVSGLDSMPTVVWGDVFTRKESTSYGPHWFWQGARLEYSIRKNAVRAEANAGGVFDFDQA